MPLSIAPGYRGLAGQVPRKSLLPRNFAGPPPPPLPKWPALLAGQGVGVRGPSSGGQLSQTAGQNVQTPGAVSFFRRQPVNEAALFNDYTATGGAGGPGGIGGAGGGGTSGLASLFSGVGGAAGAPGVNAPLNLPRAPTTSGGGGGGISGSGNIRETNAANAAMATADRQAQLVSNAMQQAQRNLDWERRWSKAGGGGTSGGATGGGGNWNPGGFGGADGKGGAGTGGGFGGADGKGGAQELGPNGENPLAGQGLPKTGLGGGGGGAAKDPCQTYADYVSWGQSVGVSATAMATYERNLANCRSGQKKRNTPPTYQQPGGREMGPSPAGPGPSGGFAPSSLSGL